MRRGDLEFLGVAEAARRGVVEVQDVEISVVGIEITQRGGFVRDAVAAADAQFLGNQVVGGVDTGCDASVHVVNMVIADAGDDFQLAAQDVSLCIFL